MTVDTRLEMEKPWAAPIASLAMIVAFFAIAYVLIRFAPVPDGGRAPAAEPSYRAAVEQPPAEPARSVVPTSASEAPRREPSPSAQGSPAPHGSKSSSPTAREQVVLKSRKALETVEVREFLRQGGTR